MKDVAVADPTCVVPCYTTSYYTYVEFGGPANGIFNPFTRLVDIVRVVCSFRGREGLGGVVMVVSNFTVKGVVFRVIMLWPTPSVCTTSSWSYTGIRGCPSGEWVMGKDTITTCAVTDVAELFGEGLFPVASFDRLSPSHDVGGVKAAVWFALVGEPPVGTTFGGLLPLGLGHSGRWTTNDTAVGEVADTGTMAGARFGVWSPVFTMFRTSVGF